MRDLLERLLQGRDLDEAAAGGLLASLTAGTEPPALVGAVLAALRAKGETAAELRGMAAAMRRAARKPEIPSASGCVDVVGTGGDGSGSLNLSTGSALLAAACGLPVVKHGNRRQSSRSGSADVLEALGMALPADERDAARCFRECGFTFLFAPAFHPSMERLRPVRRDLGVRTVFNLLGPLTNPAEPPYAVIGAFSRIAAECLAEALRGLPVRRAFVVHGCNGWDEPTPIGPFLLLDVRPGRVERRMRDPREAGLPRAAPRALLGGDPQDNARRLVAVFEGERGAHRDALVLGAALALEVSGAVRSLRAGVALAGEAIDSGTALRLARRLATPAETREAGGV